MVMLHCLLLVAEYYIHQAAAPACITQPTMAVAGKKSQASTLGTNEMPARLVYPDTEITRNSNFPGLKLITDKVWWDKN